MLNKEPYITKQAHGPYPAGSKCLVSREHYGAILVIEFEDGVKVELEGNIGIVKG